MTSQIMFAWFKIICSRFISADDSPTGDAMLIVAGSVSGTISFFTVVDSADSDNSGSSVLDCEIII